MYRKAIKILEARIGLVSSDESLLLQVPLRAEYESLLTDYHRVEEIDYNSQLDGCIFMIDDSGASNQIELVGNNVTLKGNLKELTAKTFDMRYSVFGNEGLVFRFAMKLLEEKYAIYNFHACGMYESKSNRLFIICGAAGSGKTCLILRGLELGLELFSTEIVHFSLKDNTITLYKGSLVDNIRVGNLKYNYPRVTEKLPLVLPETEDIWGKKVAVDLTKFETGFDEITDPRIIVIFPRIEEGRIRTYLTEVKERRKVVRLLYENLTEKLGQSILLYEEIPFTGFDSVTAAMKRYEQANSFVRAKSMERVLNIVGNPQTCWEGIL